MDLPGYSSLGVSKPPAPTVANKWHNLLEETTLLVGIAGANISSITAWAEKSSSPEATLLIFVLAWLFSFYYALLVARWKPYRAMYLGSLTGWRHHLRALPGLGMTCIGLFFLSITFAVEPNCTRMCIYESTFIQVIYSTTGSMLLGYGFALIYWYLANLSSVFLRGEKK